MRGGGGWSESVPEETLSRDDARTRRAPADPHAAAVPRCAILGIVIVLLAQVGTLLAGPRSCATASTTAWATTTRLR